MADLLLRAASPKRGYWRDLPVSAGVYVVQLQHDVTLELMEACGLAAHATACPLVELRAKHKRIHESGSTDILYVGKGDNVRKRVRQLAHFGVGRLKNH